MFSARCSNSLRDWTMRCLHLLLVYSQLNNCIQIQNSTYLVVSLIPKLDVIPLVLHLHSLPLLGLQIWEKILMSQCFDSLWISFPEKFKQQRPIHHENQHLDEIRVISPARYFSWHRMSARQCGHQTTVERLVLSVTIPNKINVSSISFKNKVLLNWRGLIWNYKQNVTYCVFRL